MSSGENAKDQAQKKRAARVTRDIFGVPQRQNLYPNIMGTKILKLSGLLESPSQIFEKCMQILANAKRNITE
jgi:ABC-type multidrug transport system ATPase subunit